MISITVRLRQLTARFRPGVWLPLLVAFASAGLAYLIAGRALQAAEHRLVQRHAEHGRTRAVIVASRSLAVGTTLEQDMLAQRRVPARYLPHAALAPAELGAAVGASLRMPLEPGDVLVSGALRRAAGSSLAGQLGVGERALTIAVDDAASQAGLLQPGDHVDLLYVEPPDPAGHRLRIRPLLQAVRVLATGRRLLTSGDDATGGEGPGEGNYSTLTLQVAALDAQRIALAQRVGEIIVSLRAGSDPAHVSLAALDSDAIVGERARGTPRRDTNRGMHIPGWVGGLGERLVARRWVVGAEEAGERP